MIGVVREITFDSSGRQIVSFTVTEGDFRRQYDTYKDKPLDITVKVHRRTRSLDANAFLWKLCEEIAKNQHIKKEEVYRKEIREVGVYIPLPIREDALASFRSAWEGRGVGWLIEDRGKSKHEGYRLVYAYYGSSTYDTAEMSRLIEATVEDCRVLGIEVMSERERSLLVEEWGKR